MITPKDLDVKAIIPATDTGHGDRTNGKAKWRGPGGEEMSYDSADAKPDPPLATPPHRTVDQRLTAARVLQPPPTAGCQDCWTRGRNAAIQAVATDRDPRVVQPQGRDRHHRLVFDQGREAAAAAMDDSQ